MKHVYGASQIPNAAWVLSTRSRFAPKDFTTEFCEPAEYRRFLVDNPDYDPAAMNNDAAFSNKQASKHSFVNVSFDMERPFGKRCSASNPLFFKKKTNRVSIDFEFFGKRFGAFTGKIKTHYFSVLFFKDGGPNCRTQSYSVSQKQLTNRRVRAFEFFGKFINGCTTFIERDHLIALNIKLRHDRGSTHFLSLCYACIIAYFAPIIDVLFGKKAAGRELDGKQWDQFPVEEYRWRKE